MMTDDEPRVIDLFYRAMASRVRRRLLVDLVRRNPQQVTPPPAVNTAGTTTSDRLSLELYHVHLPMLDDLGFIRWDRDTNAISRGPRFADIEPLLATLETHADAFDLR